MVEATPKDPAAAFGEHEVTAPFNFPTEEEKVIRYWRAIDAFKTSLEQSKGRKPFSFYDDRRFGWDCHGLPVEHEIDKKLGIKGKEDVMAMGIDKYNAECRAIVMTYQNEWRDTVERMGRWIDFDNGYKTMDINFMESVWWVFKTLHQKGLVYQGIRVMPYSTACTPPFQLRGWSRLPRGPDPAVTDPKGQVPKARDLQGKDLVGIEYEPIFPTSTTASRAVPSAFSPTPTSLPTPVPVSYTRLLPSVTTITASPSPRRHHPRRDASQPSRRGRPIHQRGSRLQGVHVKEADKAIQKDLKARGRLIVQATLSHQYPFCWRSGTPLIYKAIPSWADSAAGSPTPVTGTSAGTDTGEPHPLWASDDMEEVVCVGSVEELEKLSGVTGINDLHKDKIDHITIPSQQGKGQLKRVEEVFDCWFESGSMPYAQAHYPFENKEKFEKSFPADFISEGLDQTRGWFYTLLILATHLFDTAPWKNLIVSGLVLAADGKKMSKSLRNYPDPNLLINQYGADAIRLYLINSPVVRAETCASRRKASRKSLLEKDHAIKFVYENKAQQSTNVMDRWILLVASRSSSSSARKWLPTALHGGTSLGELIDELPTDAPDALPHSVVLHAFLTENLYQGLRKFLPAAAAEDKEDYRSVHFLSFPEVNESYFDPVIQRQFKALQSVVELGRVIRVNHNLPIRVPLKELVVFHTDQEYLKDVESLSDYIKEELNVRDLVLSSDEAKCGVRFKLFAMARSRPQTAQGRR
ncbi:related to ILS1 - isoleucyl-tRNA synthetase [Ustilago trichophora]|uniref:isoleucine--tRNA ligase n=1 Tax=Ustilago trichophora TaxID=86804 RepID=A0A5C3E6Y9_9BASI|nr:related to ILS1 - isoleucyl-tRNA synthetase [Ustilago trichophora]